MEKNKSHVLKHLVVLKCGSKPKEPCCVMCDMWPVIGQAARKAHGTAEI